VTALPSMLRMSQPQPGYALGVDLGTSNTVAVLRWPDGRTRPLLFDGAPIMPSGVYADERGQLHVGRDAQRLAGLDPSRFEPNPKRRIDEPGVLLGDREVATVDLLGAILAAVGRAAVEAVGFLPPAVLTYPAAWGPRRREALTTAAARAGWPPVHLLPEPVAAARYFADVLRRPVPVGASLAVFDFGGGTLDIAVVRNDNGQFSVLGSGGIEDLGGLDIDNALVEHLGRTLGATAPEVWHGLARPETTAQRRDRRLFWEDVRGAKEMLSRTTVAPVATPGTDQAIHLTREELERVAEPLLRRAVWQTGAVIQRCGLRPDQLAGLFLVGGSSRLPLAARLLHAELGIAPTVLEQPELPVAEGSLFAAPVVASAAPVAAPVSPPPSALPLPPVQKRRAPWVAAAAALVVLVLVGAFAFYRLSGRVSAVDFKTLQTGASFTLAATSSDVDYATTTTLGDHTYYGWITDKTFHLGAFNPDTGKSLWSPITINAEASKWYLYPLPDSVVAIADTSTGPGALYAFTASGGKQTLQVPFGQNDAAYFFHDFLVLSQSDSKELRALNWSNGSVKWTLPYPKSTYSSDVSTAGESSAADFRGPGDFSGRPLAYDQGDPQRIVVIGSDKKVHLVGADGKYARQWSGVDDSTVKYFASAGTFYLGYGSPYRIQAYNLNKQDEPQTVYSSPDEKRQLITLAPCGTNRLCLLDNSGSDDKTTQLAVLDTAAHKELWRKPAAGADQLTPLGDQVLATSTDSTEASYLYTADGSKQLLAADDQKSLGVRVNAASVLMFDGQLSSYPSDVSLIGVTAKDGRRTALGPLPKVRGSSCSWNETAIVCATETKVQVWKFA
jgi:molecular chaperone HscA